jgi:hypothetical protein
MTEDKILSLRFYYKGKNLDIAKENRDIKDKFVVGSDKHIHWQILDKSFPKRHLLIKKAADSFKLILHKGMQLTVKKGDEILTEDSLRSQKLLKNNELLLDKNTTGYVSYAGDWSIAYEFVKPYHRVVTDEDRRMIREYHRRPELDSQAKLVRNVFIIAILLAIIGAVVFENTYTPPVYERTLAQRVQITREVAPPAPPPPPPTQETGPAEEQTGPPAEEAPTDAVATRRGAASILGFDAGEVTGPAVEVPSGPAVATVSEQIVASGAGAGRSGSGPGTAAPGPPGRARSSFDVGAVSPSAPPTGELFRGDIDTARRLGMRDVDASVLGGETGEITYTQISRTDQLEAIGRARQRALSAGLETVDEAAIETLPPEARETVISIRQYVDPNMRQLDELFIQERQVRNIYGSVQVTLFFKPNGQVEAVEIEERPGSFFTDSFKAKAYEIMMQWRVPTSKQLPPYSFQKRFQRN